MKKIVFITCMLLFGKLSLKAQDPITQIIKEAITKVIVAVDLKIQRLQNETIWLQNAQKTIENTMSKLKLDEITDWVERQRALYADYFEELWKVKSAITYYHHVKEIIEKQIALARMYKKAYQNINSDNHFTTDEIVYMSKVYSGIVEESIKNLEGLFLVINSFKLQMTDGKRMELINEVAKAIDKNYNDLHEFTNQNMQLSISRARDSKDILMIKALYGLP